MSGGADDRRPMAGAAGAAAPSWLVPLLQQKLLVFCGSGGVGKTTASAAVGVEAAVRGRRVLAMTIDPARRLADSLGLSSLGNEETPIDLSGRLPGEQVAGSLHALMLDPAAAFHELLERIAGSPEEVERVRSNRLFCLMLNQMAGVQEYLAGEKVYDAVRSRRYDLVILDTPPTRNALDFLDSPGRIAHMLDERILRWFLPPSVEEDQRGKWLLRRLLKTSGNVVKRVLGRVFGMQLMDEVESFFLAMAGMREEFRRRSEEVRGLMSGPETSFLLVTSASEVGRREAIYFHKQIVQRRLPFAGFVVNRVHLPIEDSMSRQEHRPHLLRQASALLRGPAGTGEEPPVEEDELERLIQALQENALRVNRLAEQDRSLVRRLLDEAKCSTAPLFVPLLPEEAGDLDGLRRFAGFLTALVPDAPPSCG